MNLAAGTATPAGALDWLPVDLLGSLGPSGLLALVVWMILTGRLTPRRTVDDIVKERDYWKAAFFKEQENTQALMETGRVARDLLRALPVQQEASER